MSSAETTINLLPPKKEEGYSMVIKIAVVVFFILLIIGYTDAGTWTEWTLTGPQPTCGSGVNTYTRQCTLGSIARAIGRSCYDSAGLGESKTENYNIAGCVIGRYVILERVANSKDNPSDDDNALNIAEIVVKAPDGTSLINSSVTATSGSTYGGSYPASNLINNNFSDFAHTTGGANTSADYSKHWFRIDLGADKNIGLVEISNRDSCCQYRINGTRVRIQNSANIDVFTSPNITGVINDGSSNKLKFTFIKV